MSICMSAVRLGMVAAASRLRAMARRRGRRRTAVKGTSSYPSGTLSGCGSVDVMARYVRQDCGGLVGLEGRTHVVVGSVGGRHQGDHRAHGHLGALVVEELGDLPALRGLQLGVDLVGADIGQRVSLERRRRPR